VCAKLTAAGPVVIISLPPLTRFVALARLVWNHQDATVRGGST